MYTWFQYWYILGHFSPIVKTSTFLLFQTYWCHSHSVVPGGFDERSYITREIPGTVEIASTMSLITCKTNSAI